MLIVCPSCATSYSLTEAQLGRGRVLRCAQCRHTWHATPADAVEADEAVAGFDRGAGPPSLAMDAGEVAVAETTSTDASLQSAETDRPAPRRTGKGRPPPRRRAAQPAWVAKLSPAALSGRLRAARPWQLGLLGTVLALGLAVAGRDAVVRMAPQTARLFAAIHLPVNLRGLALDGVKSEIIADKDQAILVVEGQIRNVRKGETTVPPLTLSLRGEDGSEIYTWTAEAPHSVLAAGESTPFRTRLVAPPQEGRDVLVRFARNEEGASEAH